jgi:hypothetical protein
MGSSLLMVVLPTPTDGSPPDWAAGRAAVDALAFADLPDGLVEAVELDEEADQGAIDDDEAVLAAARARLHRRIGELEAAYGDGQEGMSRDLSFLHLFDRRLLVTGGPSGGDAPTELFDVLTELGDTGPVAAALAGNDTPVPPTAATPSLEVGQVVEVDGYGLYSVTADHTLASAPANTPINCRAEIGSVFFLFGHGYVLIQEDYRDLEDQTPFPALTPLALGE